MADFGCAEVPVGAARRSEKASDRTTDGRDTLVSQRPRVGREYRVRTREEPFGELDYVQDRDSSLYSAKTSSFVKVGSSRADFRPSSTCSRMYIA